MGGSRVAYLEQSLRLLNMPMAYRALNLVKEEMRKEKGFKRHNGDHYYYHCVDVTQLLINEGVTDEDTIVAALLHDIVEDVRGYSYETIKVTFNENVAKKVRLLTKKSHIDYKKNSEQLEEDLAEMLEDLGVALIKTADRVHNMATLLDASPEKQLRKALETEKYFLPFFKKCRKKFPWHASFFFDAKTQITHTIERIKYNHKQVTELQAKIERLEQENEELKRDFNDYQRSERGVLNG